MEQKKKTHIQQSESETVQSVQATSKSKTLSVEEEMEMEFDFQTCCACDDKYHHQPRYDEIYSPRDDTVWKWRHAWSVPAVGL
jgi:hypothetical protein